MTTGAIGRLRLIRAAFSFVARRPGQRPAVGTGSTVAALMDVGCYCVSAARMLGGEPQEVDRPAGDRRRWRRRRVRPARCASPTRSSRTSTPAWRWRRPRRARGGRLPRLAVPGRPVALPGRRVIELRSAAGPERIEVRARRTPTCSRPRTSRPRSAATAQLLLGREDAIGQAARDRRPLRGSGDRPDAW